MDIPQKIHAKDQQKANKQEATFEAEYMGKSIEDFLKEIDWHLWNRSLVLMFILKGATKKHIHGGFFRVLVWESITFEIPLQVDEEAVS